MEWRDSGLIIGLRRHGETSLIVEVMTRDHGRHLGVVRGGRSRRQAPLMQQGNSVEAVWRARLEEHLGQWSLEVTAVRAGAIMTSPLALAAMGLLGEHLRLLAERDPHRSLFEMAESIAGCLEAWDGAPSPCGDPAASAGRVLMLGELLVRFELAVLAGLGFGIDLSACAATGAGEDLVYVSPKSGRAVSRSAGAPYHDRLLPLPRFLLEGPGALADHQEVAAGFALTGYFLRRRVFEPRNRPPPDCRRAFEVAAAAALAPA